MSPFLIRLEEINKVYDTGVASVHALRDINLEIASGEYVAIMGPSGSGKSTLMNLIGCLDTPTSGRYFLDEQEIAGMGDDRLAEIRNRKIGFVFQTFNLLPRVDAFHNVELPLIYNGTPKYKRIPQVEKVLSDVGLLDRARHRPSELSGGQRQRIAIARALVNSPSIILADEPTGNLDSKTGEEIMVLFGQLSELGNTILIVTHEEYIARCSRRIITLLDGRVETDKRI